MLVYGDTGKYVFASGGSGDGEILFYSDNEAVISVDQYSGELTIHKTGTVKITALKSGGSDYVDISDSIVIMVNKAIGGAVSTPVLLDAPTETTITVCPVDDEDGTGQIVEYAISQISGVTPVDAWQTDTAFYNLEPYTAYYVYARTQENENYYTGVAQQSAIIMTAPVALETYSIVFDVTSGSGRLIATVDNVDVDSGTMVEKGKNITFTATPETGYKIGAWTDNGVPVDGLSSTYTIYDIADNHAVTVKFEVQLYNVTVNSEGENYYGSGICPFDAWRHIGAGEPPVNKIFSHWETSSDGVIFNSPTSSETYFIMPANDVTITAVFENITPTVTSVTIIPDIVDIQKGTDYVFNAVVQGEKNPGQSVAWEVMGGVSDTAITPGGVLTVSLYETATTVTVKATAIADSDKFGIATVNVTPLPPTVTGVEIVPAVINLQKGNSQTFTATVIGENDPPQSVEWSVLGGVLETEITSDGTLTVSVNETAATLTIKAVSTADMDKFGVTMVTVIPLPATITSVEVAPDTINLQKGDSHIFTATVIGENNPPQDVEWSVINGIAETVITSDGTLTVSSNETAATLIVKAASTADSDKFGVATINVTPLPPVVTGVEVMPDAISLKKGSSHAFTSIVTGDNDPPQSVAWSVIGGIAGTVITSDGELFIDLNETANSLTVVATSTLDTKISSTAKVTVIEDKPTIPTISSVDVTPNTIALNKGDVYSFSATVTGENNPDLSVKWSVIGSNGTTSIRADGTLTIGIDETASTLTVQAASVFDSSKYGNATVTVIEVPPLLPTVTGVEITPSAIGLIKGGSYTFSVVVTGENNPPQSVSWDVLGGTAATTISSDGTLIIGSNETATALAVVVTSDFDINKSGIALVTIADDTPKVSRVDVIPNIANVDKGDEYAFSAVVTGTNNPGQSVVWSVIGGNGLTGIDSNGILSVDADETSTILIVQATSTIDSSKYGFATVNVTEKPTLLTTVTGIEITPDEISLSQGDSYRFTATVTDTNNPPQDIIWSISGETDGSTITADGTLIIDVDETADSLTVVATSAFDTTKSCTATVTIIKIPPLISTVSNVEVSPNAVVLNRGDIYDFTATVIGLNNPSQAVAWFVIGGNGTTSIDSSGKLIVALDESATLLVVQAVSVADGTKSGIATATIKQPILPTVSSVEVTPRTMTIEKGSSYTFAADVTGQNNPPQFVVWNISGGTNGTNIDKNGVLTVSPSETAATITVTATSTFDDSKFATVVVTVIQVPQVVNPQAPAITINPQSRTVYVGDIVNLYVAANVTDGGVLSYQWYRNSVNSNTGGILLEGATSAMYIPPTRDVGVVYYYVVITNRIIGAARSGLATTASNPAVLSVRTYPDNNSGNNGNSNSSNNNTGNGGNQNNADNKNSETADMNAPTITDLISINGKPANATENSAGVLEIIYSISELTNYSEESGDYVVEISGYSHIYVSLPISALKKGDLTIKTDFGVVTIPNATLQAIRSLYGDDLMLVIKKGSFIISLVDADGKEVAYNDPDNPLWVTLPYLLLEGQGSNSVIAIKMVSGNKVTIPLTDYKDGYITFPTASTGKFDAFYNPKTYTDTENHWAADSISYVSARGLFSGTGNGFFSPDDIMTRAMFLTVIAQLAGADLSQYTASRFEDVPSDAWYAAPVEWAASIGLVAGVGNGNFAPDAPITREQMAVILNRFIDNSRYTLTPLPDVTSLADIEDISAWAVESVGNIHQAGIINVNADSMFEPQGVFSRAEAVTVFVALIEAINR